MRKIVLSVAAALSVSGCVSTETVQFRTTNPQQQALVRDGQPALVSRQKSSVVLVRPAARALEAGGRPVFVVGINNLSRQPVNFIVSEVAVTQSVGGQDFPMQVISYEALAQEEKNKQVARAILVGVAGAANSYSASQAGYGHYRTSRGNHGTYFSPTANVIAQQNAAIQNEAMVAATVEQGQANMAALERDVIKDNTLMPGEWYGGQLHLSPPTTPPSGNTKSYTLVITVGADRHVIEVQQAPTRT